MDDAVRETSAPKAAGHYAKGDQERAATAVERTGIVSNGGLRSALIATRKQERNNTKPSWFLPQRQRSLGKCHLIRGLPCSSIALTLDWHSNHDATRETDRARRN
jgi:hypothetical protein